MKKLETEIRYNGHTFIPHELVGINKLKVYVNSDSDYCVVTDEDGNVLIEINADCAQNFGYLEVQINK